MEIKKTILIVDDSEMNRSLLTDMLSDKYEIIEAENGKEAVAILAQKELEISLMLLDLVMPEMDGFETLALMNKKGWIKHIPVIMISAETAFTYVDRAYDLGAVDYISRPFDERTVIHRVTSNIMLGAKQKELADLLSAQVYQKEKDNRLMIEILSNIVEFRNGESGLHVLHVHTLTELILKKLRSKTDKYPLTQDEIRIICNASALHDIGKIAIPSEILNKPGRFTPEEFAIMKTHSVEGAKMLDEIPLKKNEPLIKISYEICRWHHERWDGKGYPDGLKGDEIPISAQVVALADVYDALTAERVYKKAFPHEKAVAMILNGECGAFNPVLLECLEELADTLKNELNVLSVGGAADKSIEDTVEQVLKANGPEISNRTIKLLENERMKSKFLSDLSREIVFEYTAEPEIMKLSELGSEYFSLPETVLEPSKTEFGNKIFQKNDFRGMIKAMRATSPVNPIISEKYLLNVKGVNVWCKIIARTMWSDGEPAEFEGAIGKIVDVSAETEEMRRLEIAANLDQKTGLLNHSAAKVQITSRLANSGGKQYALIFFDLDNFKKANDEYGHLFGDEVLSFMAEAVKKNIRNTDIAARMGGDEFMVFVEYHKSPEPQVKRIFNTLSVDFKGFPISVSMGVACAGDDIKDYDTLFKMADTAAYSVKKSGKHSYRFYDESMKTLMEQPKGDN